MIFKKREFVKRPIDYDRQKKRIDQGYSISCGQSAAY